MVQYWNGTELQTEDVLVSYTVYTGSLHFFYKIHFDNHIIQVNIPRNNCNNMETYCSQFSWKLHEGMMKIYIPVGCFYGNSLSPSNLSL